MNHRPKYLTAAQAAEEMGVSVWTVLRLCQQGILPANRPEGTKRWRIDPDAFDEYLRSGSNQREAS